MPDDDPDAAFNDVGEYTRREVDMHFIDPYISVNKVSIDYSDEMCTSSFYEPVSISCFNNELTQAPRVVKEQEKDYEKYRPYLLYSPLDVIKKTFENTTQFAKLPMSDRLKTAYRSPHPANNVHRRNEPVATDTVFSDTPAIDGGETSAQVFIGTKSNVIDVYPIKNMKQFVNTLEDNITERGAMDTLISDRGTNQISAKVKEVLRHFIIRSWQSEPHKQHQNPFERRYQDIKDKTNRLMDRSGSPANTWLLCLMYVAYVLNLLYNGQIKSTPKQKLTGVTPDISAALCFQWFEPVLTEFKQCSQYDHDRDGVGTIQSYRTAECFLAVLGYCS